MAITRFIEYYELAHNFVSSSEPFIIYGAGTNGQRVADYLQQYPVKLQGFCDSDVKKHGKQYHGLPIFSPQQAVNSGYIIIIASTWYQQIIPSLVKIGAKRFLNFSLIGLAKNPMVTNITERLLKLEGRLADKQSKVIFHALFEYLLNNAATTIPVSDYPQYLHPEIRQLQHINMIDGGACHGESLETFKDYLENQLDMLCFEPEISNFQILIEKINKKKLNSHVSVLCAGLWSEDAQLRFASPSASGCNANCNVNEQGDIVINTYAIDTICAERNFTPNLIKMDIEGAEVAALIGAKDTIRQDKPALAICLYHHLDDLWVIPEYIHSLRPDYKMSLGHHSDGWFETVLYCY